MSDDVDTNKLKEVADIFLSAVEFMPMPVEISTASAAKYIGKQLALLLNAYDAQRDEITRLREALEFYATEKNWKPTIMTKLDEFLNKANVHSHAISCDKDLGLDHWISKAKEIIRKQSQLLTDIKHTCIAPVYIGVYPKWVNKCQKEIEELLEELK